MYVQSAGDDPVSYKNLDMGGGVTPENESTICDLVNFLKIFIFLAAYFKDHILKIFVTYFSFLNFRYK